MAVDPGRLIESHTDRRHKALLDRPPPVISTRNSALVVFYSFIMNKCSNKSALVCIVVQCKSDHDLFAV